MLADRTLLSVTVATTFLAGGVTGWAARDLRQDPPFLPRAAEHVYASRLRALRDRGYDDAEMREATRIHQEYLDSYDKWWKEFLDVHHENLDAVNRVFDRKLEGLELKFRERGGAR